MKILLFDEKTESKGNARQKALLESSGYTFEAMVPVFCGFEWSSRLYSNANQFSARFKIQVSDQDSEANLGVLVF